MVDTVNITVRDITVGDVLIPHWSGGKDVALDVTVTNSLQAATVTRAGGPEMMSYCHPIGRVKLAPRADKESCSPAVSLRMR